MLGPPLNIDTTKTPKQPPNETNTPTINQFERITQLPTPILNDGSFSNINHHHQQQSILHSPPKEPSNFKSASSRVVSDYKPLARASSLNVKSSTSKRFVSNPLDLKRAGCIAGNTSSSSIDTNSSRNESPLTPSSSPISSTSLNYQDTYSTNDTFYSARLNCSFQFVKKIGFGNFSTVVLAKDTIENEFVAIKIISVPMDQIPNFKSFIKRELNILYHLSNHPCVTKLIDYSITLNITTEDIQSDSIEDDTNSNMNLDSIKNDNKQYIFINYCQGGNLLNFLMDHQDRDLIFWHYIKRIVCELLITVNYLHKNNIIHRDIKLENILLLYDFQQIHHIFNQDLTDQTPFINLSDFGLSKKLTSSSQLLSTRCGSQDYIAPEILMGLNYDGKLTDAWSIGVLIYSILESKLPFDLHYHQASPVYQDQNRISPSVLKRRRSRKNSPAHRIAMIDWEWLSINERISMEKNEEIRQIIKDLKVIVDLLLVRKNERKTIENLLENFTWISKTCPDFIKL